ncbi:glutathione S-transferase theta-3-like isoform X2 [Heterocephalus glaber]|uniref:glutathione transferase n=1 Tax=Heterocephalus glaber TaxID=10181 RepID=A0AAX6P4R2_HETGA|nr:glutathione S-transferase theta-3-like isoform X2 [Heterocephalus glaber]
MGLDLYLDLMSQPCRAVYIFAKKNGIPFQLRTVELLKGQHYTDSFAQVNPLRKVPALKDEDFILAESVAILLYLSHKYKTPDHWYPQDLQARAWVDEYLSWQHTALRSCCTWAMWQKMMFPVVLHQLVPQETLSYTLAELDSCLQLLETKFLRDQAFLTGPQISVADLMAITELMHVLLSSLALPCLLLVLTTTFSIPNFGSQTCHSFLPFPLKTVTTHLVFVTQDPLICDI